MHTIRIISTQKQLFLIAFFSLQIGLAQDFRVKSNRLEAQLKMLSTFGMNEQGGNDRVAFSDFDIAKTCCHL